MNLIDLFAQMRDSNDADLFLGLEQLTLDEHSMLTRILVILGEIDHRGSYRQRAWPSLFEYCVSHLKYSEGQAYRRVNAARAIRRFPALLAMFERREVTLTNLARICRLLDEVNHLSLAREVGTHRKQEVARILARWFPLPDVKERIRALPIRTPTPPAAAAPAAAATAASPAATAASAAAATAASAAATAASPVAMAASPAAATAASPAATAASPVAMAASAVATAAGATPATTPAPQASSTVQPSASVPLPRPPTPAAGRVRPLSERRYAVQFTVDEATFQQLEHAKRLTKHRGDGGSLESLMSRAIQLLHAELEKERLGKKSAGKPDRGSPSVAPRRDKGDVARATRRAVFERDTEQCTFIDEGSGKRCPSRERLEIDHIVPRGRGGRGDLDNLRVRCAAHNRLAAEQEYGRAYIERRINARAISGFARARSRRDPAGYGAAERAERTPKDPRPP